jgi:hypothetical protein
MSLPVAVTVSGIDSMEVLHQNLRVSTGFRPFTPDEMERLRENVARQAVDGRFELYKTSMMHDGAVGRSQHGFPATEELAL